MMFYLAALPFLYRAGFTDYKRREIGNCESAAILGIAILHLWYLTARENPELTYMFFTYAVCFLGVFLVFIGLWLFDPGKIGGGDVKLYAALSLLLGMGDFIFFFIAVQVFALIYAIFSKKRFVPIAPFMAISLTMLCICKLFLL